MNLMKYLIYICFKNAHSLKTVNQWVKKLSFDFKPRTVLYFRNLEFESDQKAHQEKCLKILRSAHQDIVHIMTQIHSIFANDGAKVKLCFSAFKTLSFLNIWLEFLKYSDND